MKSIFFIIPGDVCVYYFFVFISLQNSKTFKRTKIIGINWVCVFAVRNLSRDCLIKRQGRFGTVRVRFS